MNSHITQLLLKGNGRFRELARKNGGIIYACDDKIEMYYIFTCRNGMEIKVSYRELDSMVYTNTSKYNDFYTDSSFSTVGEWDNKITCSTPERFGSISTVRNSSDNKKQNSKRKVDVCLCSSHLWK